MKKIIVPTDFTAVGDVAIRYASDLVRHAGGNIFLLHIVKDQDDVDEARTKLEEAAKKNAGADGKPLGTIIRVGNIFDDIPNVAHEENAELVVMGTHGMQGMQFIVGSNALRIITESKVPMIIVQQKTTHSAKVSKLLLPLDLHKETKQKLKIAGDVAERFKAEVHLISPKETDEYLLNFLKRNIAYAEGYMESKNISYKTVITESGSGGFVKEMLKYASYIGIDMICIMNTAEERLIHAFGMDSEQKIITNEASVPVMVVNPSATLLDSRSIFAQ